jgi:hypothetical protein
VADDHFEIMIYTKTIIGPSWSWSFGSWIYTYMQSVSIATNVSSNPDQARCSRHNIMWWSLSVICGRSVVSSVSSTNKTTVQNIVENGVKHYKPYQAKSSHGFILESHETVIYVTIELCYFRLS